MAYAWQMDLTESPRGSCTVAPRPRRPRRGRVSASQRRRQPIHLDPLHRPPVQAGAQASIGTVGDSYDNALAESVNGLYKAELVYWQGPWRGADALELATLTWVDWFNNTRLHSSMDHHTPAEVEAAYYRDNQPVEQPLAGQPAL